MDGEELLEVVGHRRVAGVLVDAGQVAVGRVGIGRESKRSQSRQEPAGQIERRRDHRLKGAIRHRQPTSKEGKCQDA